MEFGPNVVPLWMGDSAMTIVFEHSGEHTARLGSRRLGIVR